MRIARCHALLPLAALVVSVLGAGCGESPRDAGDGAGQSVVEAPAVGWFTDITEESGLDFVHESSPLDELHLPAISAGGAAFLDFDGDGDLDVYLTNANHLLPAERAPGGPTNRLYRREADGRYSDVTAEARVGDSGYGMGVAVGDVDNDGHVDLFVANYGPDRLFLNQGDGTFADVTAAAGAGGEGWSSSAALCDFDRDGLLDLYVARYVDYLSAKRCSGPDGRADFCGPKSFRPIHDVVLHNEGRAADGTIRFRDVSAAAGVVSTRAAGLGLVCLDVDDDGWQDVYVANDAYANQLWINLGEAAAGPFGFRDDSLILGAAYNLHGQAQAGMGIVADDFDGDGTFDLFLTHLMNEANTLYGNLGGGAGFRDVSGSSKLGPSSMAFTGFGVAAFDLELDGDLDLFIANGKVNVAAPAAGSELPAPWNTLPEPNLLFLNDGQGRFEREEARAGALADGPAISRGVASGDIDDDGDVDLLVSNLMGRARLYRNDAPRRGHWLTVRAIDPSLGRDAVGARVKLVLGGDRAMARLVAPAGGYQASHSPAVHFGLGEVEVIDRIEVRWPDGSAELFDGGAVDRAVTLERGGGERLDG